MMGLPWARQGMLYSPPSQTIADSLAVWSAPAAPMLELSAAKSQQDDGFRPLSIFVSGNGGRNQTVIRLSTRICLVVPVGAGEVWRQRPVVFHGLPGWFREGCSAGWQRVAVCREQLLADAHADRAVTTYANALTKNITKQATKLRLCSVKTQHLKT